MEENLQTGSTEADISLETGSTPTETPQTDPQTGQPVEIDSLDRYQYKGRPLKDWEAGQMRQQDYTQKTTQIAQERRYFDNLAVDLDRVRGNPALADQFRQIYPEKFHPYLRYVTSENSRPTSSDGSQTQPQYGRLDPATEQRIMQLEKGFRDKEVAAIQSDLDRKFEKLSVKYPFADEEAVVARAQALLTKMKEINPGAQVEISEKQWDALWKSQNDRSYGLSDAQYKKQVQNQIQANKSKADIAGRGGGIPGQAPRQFKTIKEASEALRADIDNGSF